MRPRSSGRGPPSTISVVIVEPSVQRRCGMPLGQRSCCPAASGAASSPTDVKPDAVDADHDRVRLAGVLVNRRLRGEPEHRDEEATVTHEHLALDAGRTGERAPLGPWERPDVERHRAASWACTGSSSSSSAKTSASASSAGARASSTATGRPSSRATVVKAASSSPQAVIHCGERRRIEVDVERVAVRRHPLCDVDPDRGDLPRRRRQPDAGEPVDPLRLDAELRKRSGSAPPRGRGSTA